MENQVPQKVDQGSDEIDLGQLFKMIGQGLNNIFRAFLRFFLYISRNIIKLGILVIIGLAIGFGLNQISTKKQKTEVIVKPNLESKGYLYDVVNEIQANLRTKDSSFFSSLNIDVQYLEGFEITIEPIENGKDEENTEEDIQYLELLEKFQNDDLVADVVKTEILSKSTLNHRITFFYKNVEKGKEYSKKLMDYINSNAFFKELVKINLANAQERISQNSNLIEQIDNLITGYANKMEKSDNNGTGRIVLEEDQLDITGLLGLKNSLIRDNERKKLEILGQKEPIRIINFGGTQEVQKAFFGKIIVLIPLILIGLFFLWDLIKFFNRKAKEMQL